MPREIRRTDVARVALLRLAELTVGRGQGELQIESVLRVLHAAGQPDATLRRELGGIPAVPDDREETLAEQLRDTLLEHFPEIDYRSLNRGLIFAAQYLVVQAWDEEE